MSAKLTDAIRPLILLQGVTGLTGGGTNLDGIVTVGLAVPLTGFLSIGGILFFYTLRAGTDAESSPLIIRPDDYNGSTNQKVWALLDFSPTMLPGALIYQSTWNANTNSPALASGVGTKGYAYKVSVAGATTLDTINDWAVGDWVIFDGTVWDKIDNTELDATNSVKGNVQLTNDLGGTAAAPTVVSASGAFAFTGLISITGVTASQDDWNPTGLASANTIRIQNTAGAGSGANINITGLQGGAAGRVIRLINVSTKSLATVTLVANSASSSAANRFGNPNDVVLSINGGSIDLEYDPTSSLWRVIGYPAASTTALGAIKLSGDFGGTASSPAVIGIAGALQISGTDTPAQITSNQNDYALTAGKLIVKLSTDADRTITGFVATSSIRLIINIGSFNITFTDQDSGSSAANRFAIGGASFILPPGGMAWFQYDGSPQSRWRIAGAGSFLQLTGGTVTGAVTMSGAVTISNRVTVDKVSDHITALTYSSTPSFDFDGLSARTFAMTGAITPTTANKAVGRMLKLYINSDGSGPYSFTWPAWIWPQSGGAPASIAASKHAILTLECVTGTADTDIYATYTVEP